MLQPQPLGKEEAGVDEWVYKERGFDMGDGCLFPHFHSPGRIIRMTCLGASCASLLQLSKYT